MMSETEEEYDSPAEEECIDERWRWVNEHYDVLQELYLQFRGNGERVFGRAFLQRADFADFVTFVWGCTFHECDDLLIQMESGNVRPLGSSSRW
jgi:hypothetical protein